MDLIYVLTDSTFDTIVSTLGFLYSISDTNYIVGVNHMEDTIHILHWYLGLIKCFISEGSSFRKQDCKIIDCRPINVPTESKSAHI